MFLLLKQYGYKKNLIKSSYFFIGDIVPHIQKG